MRTAYRLKTIDILAKGDRVRKYDLAYQYSAITSRWLLTAVRHYGSDATTQLPP